MTSPTKERPWVPICVAAGNQYLIKPPQAGNPPDRMLMPWLDQSDPRMFVRNGELIKPYGIVEFAFVRIDPCPELDHDRAFYRELVRTDFDPTGCVPITYFDIEKLGKDLNTAQEMLQKSIPDAPAQDAA